MRLEGCSCYNNSMKRSVKIVIIVASVVAVLLTTFLLVWFLYAVPAKSEKEREELVRAYREAKFAMYEKENAALTPGETQVVFLGDSLTDGCDLKKNYPEFSCLNRGIGGDRTSDLLERMKISVYDVRPQVAVLLIGGNNLSSMFEDYEEILKGLQGTIPQTKVILLSLTSMGGRFAEKNKIAALNNQKIKAFAEEYGYEYVDVFYPLFDPDTMEIRAEYTSDGAHLTDKGYEVVSAAVTPAIKKALGIA